MVEGSHSIGLLEPGSPTAEQEGPSQAKRSLSRWGAGGVGILILLVLPSVMHGGLAVELPTFSATILAVLGLTILYGIAGNVSVGNGTFLALGGYGTALFMREAHIPFLLAIWPVTVICFVAGCVMGWPALRVKSWVYFSVYTFMVANAVPELITFWSRWTGGPDGLPLSLPGFAASSTTRAYYFCLVVSLALGAVTMAVVFSRFGRRWRASRDSSAGAAAAGVNVAAGTILTFGVSGALTGISGALQGAVVGVLSPQTYSIWVSIYLLAAVIVGGADLFSGAIVGAAFISFIPYLTGISSKSPDLVFGLVLIVVLVAVPGGVVRGAGRLGLRAVRLGQFGWVRVTHRDARPFVKRTRSGPDDPISGKAVADQVSYSRGPAGSEATTVVPDGEPGHPLLTVRNLSVAYGDLLAVRGVDLSVSEGEVLALIGPNGAGKSSVLRAVAGVAKVAAGAIHLAGEDIVGRRPWEITRKGVVSVAEGRGVFPGLSVHENLLLGASGAAKASKNSVEESMTAVMKLFPDLSGRRRQLGGSLSGGQQQMLAIGRAMMARPRVLVLDEPSLGLSPLFADEVYDALARMKASGTTMLIVEQNSTQVLDLADIACILASGAVQFYGEAERIRGKELAMTTYFGVGSIPEVQNE